MGYIVPVNYIIVIMRSSILHQGHDRKDRKEVTCQLNGSKDILF